MRRSLRRLRWQLTLSHLIAIVVTLVSMIAALMLIAGAWIAIQTSPRREVANNARIVARSVGVLVELGRDQGSLNTVLRLLSHGHVPAAGSTRGAHHHRLRDCRRPAVGTRRP